MSIEESNLQDPPEYEIEGATSSPVVRGAASGELEVSMVYEGLRRVPQGELMQSEALNLTEEQVLSARSEAERRKEKADSRP